MDRIYLAIDLKSFYASVECVERGLDPLNTNLVVADESRTEKTICLAVSPPLKAYGIKGRPRLFEVIEKTKAINAQRKRNAPNHEFIDKSYIASELDEHADLELSYIVAPPQMAKYIAVSTRIYGIYLRYIAPQDIHVYSIDEVFIDATPYLQTYKMSAHELAMMLVRTVLKETGITATAGIGTNLYLCKIAMDIVAKKMKADKDGVRIAELDEMQYRQQLWEHKPLSDFWRIGSGYQTKLEANGMFTMGDVAFTSLFNEEILYKLFGINAELLIDHAWGYEPCTMADIKAYKPLNNSLSSGQVLLKPYSFDKARIVIKEMADQLALDLVEKQLVGNQVVINIGYDSESLINSNYKGPIAINYYGKQVPKEAHGSKNLAHYTSSSDKIVSAAAELYDEVVKKDLLLRHINVTVTHVIPIGQIPQEPSFEQMDFFTDYSERERKRWLELETERMEHNKQIAILDIKQRYGKNAILRAVDFMEDATAITRNNQIGGHKA